MDYLMTGILTISLLHFGFLLLTIRMMPGDMTFKLPFAGPFKIFAKDLKIGRRKPGRSYFDFADVKMTAETTLNMTLLHSKR
jgi:hypothetical protein